LRSRHQCSESPIEGGPHRMGLNERLHHSH
jgi:hypothetical protein